MFTIPWWRSIGCTKEFFGSIAVVVNIVDVVDVLIGVIMVWIYWRFVVTITSTFGSGCGSCVIRNWSIVPSRSHGCNEDGSSRIFGVGHTSSEQWYECWLENHGAGGRRRRLLVEYPFCVRRLQYYEIFLSISIYRGFGWSTRYAMA